jgi:hypothetical protein
MSALGVWRLYQIGCINPKDVTAQCAGTAVPPGGFALRFNFLGSHRTMHGHDAW